MDDLLAAARATGANAFAANSVSEALHQAEQISAGTPVVVSGSVYLVGEARVLLVGARQEIMRQES
jgi:dihydrofolate synthase/folylpolyglutamate synthase